MPSAGGDDVATRGSTVDPARLARVRAIFEAALEQPAAMRAAFVAGACVGDPVLANEAHAMLAADATGEPLLDAAGRIDHEPAGPIRLRATPLGASVGQGGPALQATPGSSPEEGRFPAGTVLAGRYRILGMLGRGGMGEVYRAHDLILNQTVALKFLNPTQLSEAALARFRNEVRIARQVSHPNVCRVYDLGMVEGLHFLSMEYIDGEDLASLLRRIGRLPQDKAIEFTRKICAGLSAAHERGVLHRDLKPANIMIDGRGQPRITDFGLAGLAAEIPLSDLRSGTPAYMSPEQKAGKDVTTRSDIYSLGLILHEMFTGKRRADTQSHPSDLVKDLDPMIDRLILRCLDEDPKRRPGSALNVAMALPGADPVAAALAAGETPSPEMVAASQEKEGFRARTALICLVAMMGALAVGLMLGGRTGFVARAPLNLPPEALTDRAQQFLARIGYPESPAASASGWTCCDQRVQADLDRYSDAERKRILASHQPPVITFWYRQHRASFRLIGAFGRPTDTEPPNSEPGMILVRTNALGRLIRLQVQPWQIRRDANAGAADWRALFDAAGLAPERFHEVAPDLVPPMMADLPMAWSGSYGPDRRESVRVEAAFWQGRPVWFDVNPLVDLSPRAPAWAATLLRLPLMPFVLAAGSLTLAWRNWRSRRIDYRGAVVVTVTVGVLAMTSNPLRAGPLPAIWLLYCALEPQTRRYWPDSLISWTRLMHGQFRNPLVASHVLAGLTACGLFAWVVWPAYLLFLPEVPSHDGMQANLNGSIGALLRIPDIPFNGIFNGFGLLGLIIIMRSAIRRLWLADVIALLLFGVQPAASLGGAGGTVLTSAIFLLGVSSVWILLLRQFGFLSFLSMWTFVLVMFTPLTAQGWLGERLFPFHALPILVAVWCVWVILADRRQPSLESAA